MNKLILIGNTTKAVEVITFNSGKTLTKLSIATSRKYTDNTGELKEEVMYMDAEANGKRGETIASFVNKGDKLMVEGYLRLSTWRDSQGNSKSKHVLIVENFEMLTPKRNHTPQQAQNNYNNQSAHTNTRHSA
jgi:single-strand DNA-binding protein